MQKFTETFIFDNFEFIEDFLKLIIEAILLSFISY